MAVELATAYFSFLPSLAGTAAAAAPGLRALEGQAAASGARSGALMGGALAGGIGKFVPVIGGVLAGIGIADFFGDAIDAASNLNESANAVRVSFGDAAGEVEKLGQTSADRLGLSSNDFNALAVRFSSFARTIAGEGGNVADTLDELTTRGADFASVYNLEASDALQLFQSGLAGESEPLRRFGVDISAATVAQTAYRLGIAETGAELTEQQKIQARYAAILEQTSAVAGDRLNTEDQLANKQRENAAKFEDALARVGTALLPAATEFANFVGSDENIARLDRIVDLFIAAEPVVTGIADGLIVIADTKFDELDTVLSFFDALADGKVTLDEIVAIYAAMPSWLQNLTNGMAGFFASVANFVIDTQNTIMAGFEAIVNASPGVLLSGNKLKIPRVGRVSTASLSLTPKKGFPGQADGGFTTGSGWSWVGEHGPELAYMPQGATVAPLDASPLMGGGDLRPLLVRLIEETAKNRYLMADGQVLAETAATGFAQQASLGAA